MLKFILLAVLLLLPSISFPENASTYTAAMSPDGREHITITGGSYFFRPDNIVVRVNVPVELTVVAEPTWLPHDFVLKAPGVDIKTSISTVPKIFDFTPVRTGEYKFYCDKRFLFFKSHRERGMQGSLRVVE